jgi:hypothetical protein
LVRLKAKQMDFEKKLKQIDVYISLIKIFNPKQLNRSDF